MKKATAARRFHVHGGDSYEKGDEVSLSAAQINQFERFGLVSTGTEMTEASTSSAADIPAPKKSSRNRSRSRSDTTTKTE